MSIAIKNKRTRNHTSDLYDSEDRSPRRGKQFRDPSSLKYESFVSGAFTGPTVHIRVQQTEFCVSRYTLEATVWFKTALSWQQPLIELPTDSEEAMRIVLYILHHQYSSLPKDIKLEDLFQLAAVCDKYDLVPYVRPHVLDQGWMSIDFEHLRGRRSGTSVWCFWPLILSTFEKPGSARLKSIFDTLASGIKFDTVWLFERDDEFCQVEQIEGIDSGMSGSLLVISITEDREDAGQTHANVGGAQARMCFYHSKLKPRLH